MNTPSKNNPPGLNPALTMKYSIPISQKYDTPFFEAVALQIVLGVLSLMILDGGDLARICGVTLIAFWGGATLMIWRRPESPTRMDVQLVRFGYLPLIVIAFFLVQFIWHLRGI